jgi:hypothetical protein
VRRARFFVTRTQGQVATIQHYHTYWNPLPAQRRSFPSLRVASLLPNRVVPLHLLVRSVITVTRVGLHFAEIIEPLPPG